MVREGAGRLSAVATLPMQEPEKAGAELRRAVTELGLRGAQIGPHVEGTPLDDARLRPVLATAQDLGVPLLLHPYYVGTQPELVDFYLTNLLGNPWQSAVCAAHLILSGTLDAFPSLDLVLVHGGGHLPYQSGRLDHGHRVRPEAKGCKDLPSSYLRRFHYDTLTHSPQALRWLVELVGADRVVYGTDVPFDMGGGTLIDQLGGLRLDADALALLAHRNADRLFALEVPMAEHLRLLLHLDGKDVPAADGGTFPVTSPLSGETIFEVAHATSDDVDRAVAAARQAYDDQRWRGQRPRDRARVLNRAAALLADQIDEWARLETLQIGRPLREMRAQLARLPEWLEYFGAVAQTAEGSVPDFGPAHLNVVRRVPLGVAGLITPWNHPLLLITMKKVSAALAAGNSLVVKPSELGPAVPLALAALLEEAGVPPGVVNVVTGLGPTTGRALSEHRGLDKLDITGGTETGRVVAGNAGRNLIPVTAELGGKAPVIVFEDAPTEQAVAGALFASFIATGQTCVQGARLLVQRSAYDEIVGALVTRTRALRLGDPFDQRTQLGPLVSQAQGAKVVEAVDRARAQGATVLCGGKVPDDPALSAGWFYEPTVIADVSPEHDIWHEEVFGPLTVAVAFDDEDDAIAKANDCQFGLAASIWTADVGRSWRVAQMLDIGVVWINDHHRIDPASPWGGTKDSGLGSENGWEAYRGYTHPQSIVVNTSRQPFDWFATTEDLRYS